MQQIVPCISLSLERGNLVQSCINDKNVMLRGYIHDYVVFGPKTTYLGLGTFGVNITTLLMLGELYCLGYDNNHLIVIGQSLCPFIERNQHTLVVNGKQNMCRSSPTFCFLFTARVCWYVCWRRSFLWPPPCINSEPWWTIVIITTAAVNILYICYIY